MSNHNFWGSTITIGSQSFPRFMGAPMDGITDSPMRKIIREFSKNELLFTEMRHVDCVAHEPSGRSLKYDPVEQPLTFQISANRPMSINKAIEKILAAGFTSMNFNAACPAPAVIKSGSGSALMGNLPLLKELLQECLKSINNRVPFSLKIRAGFKEKNALEVAQIAQDLGMAAIIIHPRTQPERFAARLDYDLVAAIKKAVSIPVIFSGNITNFTVAERVYSNTGVDAFMVGRALWGAPWKIKELTEASHGRTFTVDLPTIFHYIIKHLDFSVAFYGPFGYGHFKKHLAHYIRHIPDATHWRKILLQTQAEQAMRTELAALLKTVTTNQANEK